MPFGDIDRGPGAAAGGIAVIRDAFQQAGDGRLPVAQATMIYGSGNTQILQFTVLDGDGRRVLISDPVPPGGDLAQAARAMARKALGDT